MNECSASEMQENNKRVVLIFPLPSLYILVLHKQYCDFHHSYVFISLFTSDSQTITTNLPGQRN